MSHSPRPKYKIFNLFFNLLILVITVVFMAGVLEIIFRWSTPAVKLINKDWVHRFIKYNPAGFRDHNYSLKKPEKVFRILVLGDSQTFGHGIERLEDTFPKLLETYLNTGSRGFRFEVLNFALPGWNTDTHVQNFFKKGLSYQPDLVLLIYYHNDIQAAPLMDCDSTDIELFSGGNYLKKFFYRFRLYQFLKFRVNRGLEQAGEKPTYTECRRRIYESRSWNIESLYLDTLFHSSKRQNIHFMLVVLPVLFHMEKDYPLGFAHSQMAEYCSERNLVCVDLLDEVFDGTATADVIISAADRHLNEKGTELIARNLLDHLAPLKNLRYLTRFEEAFTLQELLDDQGLVPILDNQFEELVGGGFFSWKQKGIELNAWRDWDAFHFLKLASNSITRKRISLEETVLDGVGRFMKRETNFYQGDHEELTVRSALEFNGTHWRETQWSNSIDSTPGEFSKRRQSQYAFRYESRFNETLDQYFWKVALEPNAFFEDPLTLERALFSAGKDLEPVSEEGLLKILSFYYSYPFFQGKWSRQYAPLLAREVVKRKPSIPTVKAAKIFLDSISKR
ncbi:MAG: hypothetical protein VYC17_04100 [Nitrospinota bacterium]|nr:hypothetical protein [Nitrospinota bacterium]